MICNAGSLWAHCYINVEVTCRGCFFHMVYWIIPSLSSAIFVVAPYLYQKPYSPCTIELLSMQYLMNTRPCMKFSAVFHPPCSGVKISRAYHWYNINEFFFLPNLPLFCSYRFISNFLYRCTIGVIFVFLIIGEIHPLHPKSQFLQNMQQLCHTLLGGGLKSRYGGIFGNVDTSNKVS